MKAVFESESNVVGLFELRGLVKGHHGPFVSMCNFKTFLLAIKLMKL